jgi:hypothetical protein
MIITLLLWLVIFFTVMMYGRLALGLISRFARKTTGKIHPLLTFLAGLALLTVLGDLLSLFSPLDGTISLLILAGALVILLTTTKFIYSLKFSVWRRPTLSQGIVWLMGILIFISVIDLASRSPANPDTAIHHAQAIHWIESYKAVPGLGNLTTRLAYNSNWLLDNALFSYAGLKFQSFHALPGLLVLLSLFYFLEGCWQLVSGEGKSASLIRALLIPIFFYIIPAEVSSPGTDLPAILITWVILSESLDGIWQVDPESDGKQFLLGSLIVYALTIKLSTLPLLILPGSLMLVNAWKENGARGLKMIILGSIIALPWMARNVILSGYLIYPFPWLDVFQFDWKIPLPAVYAEVQTINNWARHTWIGSQQHDYSLPLQEWVPMWFKAESLNRRIITALAGSGILGYLILILIKPARQWLGRHGVDQSWQVLVTAFVGCLFWFLTAPDFRFGYGFVVFSILLMFSPFFFTLLTLPRGIKNNLSLILILALVINQVVFYESSFQSRNLSTRWVVPESYMSVPTSRCDFKNFTVWCAELYDQCWYNPFPCVPRALPEVEMRGGSFQDGFRDRQK